MTLMRQREALRAPNQNASCQLVSDLLRRILQLQEGNPCLRTCNRTPSCPHSNLPSNWRILQHNHTAWMWLHNQSGQDIPFHASCSTMLSCQQTNPLASWHIRQHNCKGLQAWVVQLEQLASPVAAGESQMGVVPLVDIPCGGPCSTTLSFLHPTVTLHLLRNCRDRRLAQGVLGVELALGLAWELSVEVLVVVSVVLLV